MVERQLSGRDVRDERVLRAMERVPRELFVPESLRNRAYDEETHHGVLQGAVFPR